MYYILKLKGDFNMKIKRRPRPLKEEWEERLEETRQRCIKDYRDFALLDESADIDPDNFNEYALAAASRRNYYDINDLKKLLSERGRKSCK